MPGKLLKEVIGLLPVGVDVGEFSRVWALSNLELPAYGRGTLDGGCKGVVKNGGLYTQCMSKVCRNGFCKRCENSFVEEGMPKLGLWGERIGEKDWTTTDGRRPITYMQYLKKQKMTRADGEEFLRSKDVDVSQMPESEWELPSRRRGRGRAVSDTSSEGERTTIRFLPLEGKKKSPKKDESHSGVNGAKLRVCVYQESKLVTKVNPTNWTDEAHVKFAELYCEGRMGEDEGKEFGKRFTFESKLNCPATVFLLDKDTEDFREFHMKRVGTKEAETLRTGVELVDLDKNGEEKEKRFVTVVRTVPGIKLPMVVKPLLKGGHVEFVDTRSTSPNALDDFMKGKTKTHETMFRTVNNITKHAVVDGVISIIPITATTCKDLIIS